MVAMTSPLHRNVHFACVVCQLLHFCQMLSNPSIDLELEYIFRKPMKRRFQQCIVRPEINLFMHESNTFLLQNTPLKPLSQWGKQPQNPPISLEARGPTSNTWMPGPTLLTTPNSIQIQPAVLPRCRPTDRQINRYNPGKCSVTGAFCLLCSYSDVLKMRVVCHLALLKF